MINDLVRDYKVLCFVNNQLTYIQYFRKMNDVVEYLYNIAKQLNVEHLLKNYTIFPTIRDNKLYFKRLFIKNAVPNTSYIIIKLSSGEIDHESYEKILKEML